MVFKLRKIQNPMSLPNLPQESENSGQEVPPTPFRCFVGATISSGMGFALYKLMISIATTFALKPIHSDNPMAVNIGSAVRTLVVGIVALGMGIFGLVATGLFALGIQLVIQGFIKKESSSN
jgi:hypothetical protein